MTQTIPFNVSDVGYAASGYMGDGTTLGAIMQLPQKGGDTTCGGDRSPPAKGTCYSVTYTPGSMGWGGVYWQYPGNNWGNEGPGISIGPGATKVAVWAKGMTGGEQLVFTVGGINNMHNSGTCADGFEVQFPANSAATKMTQALTTSWAEYDIPLPSDYSSSPGGVIGAFAWVATSASTAPMTFKLDSITWE